MRKKKVNSKLYLINNKEQNKKFAVFLHIEMI